ncbi:hypothetical protein WMF30_10730 [Sorangium sp. So ce134]
MTDHIQWEYEELDTADTYARKEDYKDRLKKLGEEGWEAYSVVAFVSGGMRFFLKRPIAARTSHDHR